jgi:PIN domain nuclease of toxin-antitoxin system
LRSIHLPDFTNPDPVDRIIIATALVLGRSVVTKDRNVRSYSGVKTIW